MGSLTLEDFKKAKEVVGQRVGEWKRTPLLCHWRDLGGCSRITQDCDLYLKMENTQVTGSYKVRGIINQLHHLELQPGGRREERQLVTMSAGNYGKALASLSTGYKKRTVVMSTKAPISRKHVIEGYGAQVERVPADELHAQIEKHVKNGTIYMNSLNDINLIIGHGCIALELLEDLPDPDIILVPCGGGCLVAGIAAAVHLSGLTNCRIYGVEPEQACTMSKSLQEGKPLTMPVNTIATGLSPPYVEELPFRICQKYVEGILLVPEAAIVQAMKDLYRQGIVVEPSAAVTYAALALGLVPNTRGRKVAAILTGGNISPQELLEHFVDHTSRI